MNGHELISVAPPNNGTPVLQQCSGASTVFRLNLLWIGLDQSRRLGGNLGRCPNHNSTRAPPGAAACQAIAVFQSRARALTATASQPHIRRPATTACGGSRPTSTLSAAGRALPSDVVLTSKPARGSSSPIASHETDRRWHRTIRQRAGPLGGPVCRARALMARVRSSEHATARAERRRRHQRIASGVPPRRAGSRLLIKPSMSCGRAQFITLYQSVLPAPTARAARVRLRQNQRALLVRNGDVAPDKTVGRKVQHELGKASGGTASIL